MPFESFSTTSGRQRSIACIIAAVLSALTQATLLGIFTSLVVIDLARTSLRVSALAAIVFDAVVTLIMLAVVAGAIQPVRKMKTPVLEPAILVSSASISLATSILTIYILVKAWSLFRFTRASLSHSLTASLIVIGLTVWSINLMTQLITYALLGAPVSCFRRQPEEISTIGYRYPSSPRRRFSMAFRSNVTPATPEKVHSSDPYSPSSASLRSLKSSRHGSISQVFGPLGSKTRLLISQSMHGRESDSQLTRREASLEIACRGETPEPVCGADLYELSSSPPLLKHPSPLTRLETIPGSRPVSPANPLDGPYLGNEVAPEMLPLPESPDLARPQSPMCQQHDLPFPPMIGEVAFQSHIHPLFRSGSPGPPPVMSPGTVVTASPQAGQFVTTEVWRQRSAHNSRAGTPDLSPQCESALPPWRRGSGQSSRSATPDISPPNGTLRRQRTSQESRTASPEHVLTAQRSRRQRPGSRAETPDMPPHGDGERAPRAPRIKHDSRAPTPDILSQFDVTKAPARPAPVHVNRSLGTDVLSNDGMPNFSRPGATKVDARMMDMI